MSKRTSIVAAGVALGGWVAAAQALQISYVGSVGAIETQAWRTSSTGKSLDINGDNIYGSQGYLIFSPKAELDPVINDGYAFHVLPQGSDSASRPGFIASNWNAAAGSRQNFGYALIDNPAGGDFQIGHYNVGAFSGPANVNVVGFNFTQAGTYRVGLIVDTALNGVFASDRIGIFFSPEQNVQSGPITRDGVLETHFFDVTVLQSDIFDVFGNGAVIGTSGLAVYSSIDASGYAILGGMTFDAIPEPGSLGLLAVGGMAALRRRRG